jgi:hypothetical protein
MEKAGLTAPLDLKSDEWSVTDLAIMGPAWINPDKKVENLCGEAAVDRGIV